MSAEVGAGGRLPVGKLSEFAEGRAKVLEAFGRTVAVWKAEGQLYAIDDCCPHRGGSLGEGELEPGCKVACPLHGWTFELATGKMDGQPNTRIATYPLQIEGEQVFLCPPLATLTRLPTLSKEPG